MNKFEFNLYGDNSLIELAEWIALQQSLGHTTFQHELHWDYDENQEGEHFDTVDGISIIAKSPHII